MTGIHTNEEKNFWKHFFSQRDNETGEKEREIHRVPTQMRRKGAGGGAVLCRRCSFSPHPPFWASLYTHSSPRQKEQGSFRACGTGGWGEEGRGKHDWWSSGWLIKGSRECREIIREKGVPCWLSPRGEMNPRSSALLSCQAGWWWKSEGQA